MYRIIVQFKNNTEFIVDGFLEAPQIPDFTVGFFSIIDTDGDWYCFNWAEVKQVYIQHDEPSI